MSNPTDQKDFPAMAVILTSPVEGLQPGDVFEGPNEDWLLQEGYAKPTTKRRKEPGFLDKPRHLEYEHDEDAERELITSDAPNPLVQNGPRPVAPETAVQTGHPQDPTTDDDENHMPSQSDVVKEEVTGAIKPVGQLEGVQTPSEDTLQAADALHESHNPADSVHTVDEDGEVTDVADPDEASGQAPAVSEDEHANPSVPTVNENPVNYAEPEQVEQEDPAEAGEEHAPEGTAPETAADADGISSEEERTLEEQPQVDGDDVELPKEEPAESDETS